MLFFKAYAQHVTVLPNGITPAAPGAYQRLSYDELMALPSPQEGDIAYDLTYKCMRVFSEGKWVSTIVDPFNYSPNIIPVINAGGTSSDTGNSFAMDDSSNIYVTGTFAGIAFFGATYVTSNSNNGNIYVAKYSKSGILKWIKTGGGPAGTSASDIVVDSKGNLYVRGFTAGQATFGTITFAVGTDETGGQSYLTKLQSDGTFEWVKATNSFSYAAVAIDDNDNLYLTGSFKGSHTLGATTITSSPNSTNTALSYDFYLAKYDTEADNWLWAKSYGSTSTESSGSLVLDGSGNLYVTGAFGGTVAFGSISKTASAVSNSFIGKYNPVTEDWVWVETHYPAKGFATSVDNSGNLYLTGNFTSTITLGSITKTGVSGGNTDVFIAKINSSGIVEWLLTAGGTGGSDDDGGTSIQADASSNIYVTGYFAGTAKFGTKTITATANKALFIAKYNSIGGIIWVQKIDRASGSTGSINNIIISPDGNVYAVGSYSGTTTFGKTTLIARGETDIFVFKVD